MIDVIKETSLNMTVVTVDNPSNILINNTRSNKTRSCINNGSNYSLELKVQLNGHVDTVEMTLVLEGTPEVLYIIPERSKSRLPQYTTREEGGRYRMWSVIIHDWPRWPRWAPLNSSLSSFDVSIAPSYRCYDFWDWKSFIEIWGSISPVWWILILWLVFAFLNAVYKYICLSQIHRSSP